MITVTRATDDEVGPGACDWRAIVDSSDCVNNNNLGLNQVEFILKHH